MLSHHLLPALVLQLNKLVSIERSPGYMKDRQFLKGWMMLEKRKIKSVV